jgi:hypothetical protein
VTDPKDNVTSNVFDQHDVPGDIRSAARVPSSATSTMRFIATCSPPIEAK